MTQHNDLVLKNIDAFLASGKVLAREMHATRKGFLFRGVLGELLVYRALLQNGMRPRYRGGMVRNVDIEVDSNGTTVTIDVKEKTTDKWVRQDYWKVYERNTDPLAIKQGLSDFYVYVDSLKFIEDHPPDFYVLTRAELCALASTIFDHKRLRPNNPDSGDFWITLTDVRLYLDNDFDKIGRPAQ